MFVVVDGAVLEDHGADTTGRDSVRVSGGRL
jgi:hypothetical protein